MPYTCAQAAEKLGVTTGRVRLLAIQRGVGSKFGPNWAFTDADIEKLRPGPTGRPRIHPLKTAKKGRSKRRK